MNRTRYLATLLLLAIFAIGYDVRAQKDTVAIDVQHYKIDAELIPASQLLRARSEVTFVPASDTRSVVFEMNGSLAIKRITVTTPG